MPGTQLAADGHACEDIDECRTDNGGCSHSCLNTLGTHFCACPEGYMLGDDWKTCDGPSLIDYSLHYSRPVFLLFQTLTNAITIPTMTRIDCVLECVAIRSDHTSAWIRTRSQSHAKLDSNFTTKTANAKVSGVSLSLSSTCPSFPVVVADIDECASTSNGGCSHKCINTEGSHRCECPVGLFLETDNTTCQGLCVNTATEQQVSNWRRYIVQI